MLMWHFCLTACHPTVKKRRKGKGKEHVIKMDSSFRLLHFTLQWILQSCTAGSRRGQIWLASYHQKCGGTSARMSPPTPCSLISHDGAVCSNSQEQYAGGRKGNACLPAERRGTALLLMCEKQKWLRESERLLYFWFWFWFLLYEAGKGRGTLFCSQDRLVFKPPPFFFFFS